MNEPLMTATEKPWPLPFTLPKGYEIPSYESSPGIMRKWKPKVEFVKRFKYNSVEGYKAILLALDRFNGQYVLWEKDHPMTEEEWCEHNYKPSSKPPILCHRPCCREKKLVHTTRLDRLRAGKVPGCFCVIMAAQSKGYYPPCPWRSF